MAVRDMEPALVVITLIGGISLLYYVARITALTNYLLAKLKDFFKVKESKFFTLPAELRDHIYYHVALNELRDLRTRKHPLLAVSRQVRGEFSTVLYGRTVFSQVNIHMAQPPWQWQYTGSPSSTFSPAGPGPTKIIKHHRGFNKAIIHSSQRFGVRSVQDPTVIKHTASVDEVVSSLAQSRQQRSIGYFILTREAYDPTRGQVQTQTRAEAEADKKRSSRPRSEVRADDEVYRNIDRRCVLGFASLGSAKDECMMFSLPLEVLSEYGLSAEEILRDHTFFNTPENSV